MTPDPLAALRAFLQQEKDKALVSYEATTGLDQAIHAGSVAAFMQVLAAIERIRDGEEL